MQDNLNLPARRSLHPARVIKERAEVARHFQLFSEIPLEDCQRIVAVATQHRYPKNKKIFFEGDRAQEVILLTSGSIKLAQSNLNGDEVILRLVGAGETLCFECFSKCIHCSTATAVQVSTAFVWQVSQFRALADGFPMLTRNLSCALLDTLNQLEIRFREVSTDKVGLRLSSQLLRLLGQVGAPVKGHVKLAVSQQDLAKMIGTTIFTVSRLFSLWAEQGIVVSRRPGVIVLDIVALQKLHRSQIENINSESLPILA